MQSGLMENSFRILNYGIYLRDMIIEDIDDYITWNTTEIEWQDWDAPWEKEDVNIENIRSSFFKRLNRKIPEIRTRLEICNIDNEHLGWVTTYYINGDKKRLAVGIDIPCNKFRGKNTGELALTLFISYLLKSGLASEIYTQTWSGNHRMVSLAGKCGFDLVDREINYRQVKGEMYDGLTFKLNNDLFWNRFKHLK
jgi:RimJ/RimL family protein N-acetyltransferase